MENIYILHWILKDPLTHPLPTVTHYLTFSLKSKKRSQHNRPHYSPSTHFERPHKSFIHLNNSHASLTHLTLTILSQNHKNPRLSSPSSRRHPSTHLQSLPISTASTITNHSPPSPHHQHLRYSPSVSPSPKKPRRHTFSPSLPKSFIINLRFSLHHNHLYRRNWPPPSKSHHMQTKSPDVDPRTQKN